VKRLIQTRKNLEESSAVKHRIEIVCCVVFLFHLFINELLLSFDVSSDYF